MKRKKNPYPTYEAYTREINHRGEDDPIRFRYSLQLANEESPSEFNFTTGGKKIICDFNSEKMEMKLWEE